MAQDIYDKIMTLAKRRGFIYPSYEIYGGVAGFYDYGPLGSQLKHNVENIWRNFFALRDQCIEISTPSITLYEVLKASGHVEEFTDLTVDCKQCTQSFKVEDIIGEDETVEEAVQKDTIRCPQCGKKLSDAHPVNLMFHTKIGIGREREAFLRPETAQGIFTNFHLLYRFNREKLPLGVIQIGRGYRNEISPRQGTLRQREFNMAEAEIFVDPENKTHPHFHQIKDFTLLLYDNKKEFTLTAQEAVNKQVINNQALAYYMCLTQEFLMSIGIDQKKFRFRKHADDELAHYAQECWDAELYSERFGWIECVGIADRSAYDLSAHITSSSTDMHAQRKYENPVEKKVTKIIPRMDKLGPLFKNNAGKIKDQLESMDVPSNKKIMVTLDGETIELPKDSYDIVETTEKQTGEKFVPHVIEPSFGIDRILYFLLEHSYHETKKNDEEYRILSFPPPIAPVKIGVFPLVSDDKLVAIAHSINTELRSIGYHTYYDESGTIGRRYARMDEIGTPYCITIDHDSLKDNTVTIRNRDTAEQIRKKKEELSEYFSTQFYSRC